MAFFPYEMAVNESMQAMQELFRQREQYMHPYGGMGMAYAQAHAQAQSRCGRYGQWPHFSSQQQNRGSNGRMDDGNNLRVELDVDGFTPGEVTVKVVNSQVVIEGNHEARRSGGVNAARHFIHHYLLPEGLKSEDVTSSLSSDGILIVTAPKSQSKNGTDEKVIPITITGALAKKIDSGIVSSSTSSGGAKEKT